MLNGLLTGRPSPAHRSLLQTQHPLSRSDFVPARSLLFSLPSGESVGPSKTGILRYIQDVKPGASDLSGSALGFLASPESGASAAIPAVRGTAPLVGGAALVPEIALGALGLGVAGAGYFLARNTTKDDLPPWRMKTLPLDDGLLGSKTIPNSPDRLLDDLYQRYLQDPRNYPSRGNPALAPGRIEIDQGHVEQPTLVDSNTPNSPLSSPITDIDHILENVIQSVHKHGPRGAPSTIADLNIIAQECRDYLSQTYPTISRSFYHVGGADWEGDGPALREWYLPGLYGRKGATLSDLTWLYDPLSAGLDTGSLDLGHINSQSTHLNGRPITRERWSIGNLARNAINWVKGNGQYHLAALGKRREGETDQEFTKRARQACKDLFDPWIRTIMVAVKTSEPNKATQEKGQDSPPRKERPIVTK